MLLEGLVLLGTVLSDGKDTEVSNDELPSPVPSKLTGKTRVTSNESL